MFTLSGFADEISPDLDTQIQVLSKLNISFLELRGVWGQNVLALGDDDLTRVKAALDDHGIGVSAIGSPIGKIKIDDPFEPHLEAFRRTLYVAERFESPYIRMFSFFVPAGEADAHRDQVIARLRALLDEAKGHDVILLHENESDIYGDVPRRCLDIMQTMASPQMRLTFDPDNFARCGARPYDDAYPMLEPYVAYMHIKDIILAENRRVPAGQGDGQIPQLLRALQDKGYDGFLSLEPHLASGGPFKGYSGPELFESAVKGLRAVLSDMGALV